MKRSIDRENVEPAYECLAVLVPDEEDGGYSVFVRNLRGIHSQGTTEEEALENIREALVGVIASYAASGRDIPWSEEVELPPGAIERRILVNG